jgi:hypothetical protein
MYVLTPHNYVALCLAARFSHLGAAAAAGRDVILIACRSTITVGEDGVPKGEGAAARAGSLPSPRHRRAARLLGAVAASFGAAAAATAGNYIVVFAVTTCASGLTTASFKADRFKGLCCGLWMASLCLGAAVAAAFAADADPHHRVTLAIWLAAAALLCLAACLFVVALRHALWRRPEAAADGGAMELVAVEADAAGEVGADERQIVDTGPAEAGARGPLASAFLGLALLQVAPRARHTA